jgi:hypothetical protein
MLAISHPVLMYRKIKTPISTQADRGQIESPYRLTSVIFQIMGYLQILLKLYSFHKTVNKKAKSPLIVVVN